MFTVGEGFLDNTTFLQEVVKKISDFKLVKTNKSISYYNIPAAFDIETSSFYQDGIKDPHTKRAIMYIWMLGVYDVVTYGRTWNELVSLITVLKQVLDLNDNKRLLMYVHNLPYEFGFMRKWLEWDEVFILSKLKPVTARSGGLEFRCSLKLSGGRSLENVGKELKRYHVEKAVGNLDYNIIRTPNTPLSQKELLYCENDIRVLLSYIQEKIESDGDITRIPLTNTGYVRNYCRKECYKRWKPYRNLMKALTLTADEYKQSKLAFQGGFTHANAHYVGKILNNVASYDFTSSYPAVMLLEKFPMSRPELVTTNVSESELEKFFLSYACMMDLELWGVRPKLHQDHPISSSKCRQLENFVLDNGRVVFAGHLITTITEQDYFVYNEFYDWDEMAVSNLRLFEKQYLPKQFANAVLKLYQQKTTLKGVKGREIDYMISKNMANASFGMTVTDPVREEFKYVDNEYISQLMDVEKAIEDYNKNVRRFLYYPWGVWVTAHARANLFSGIIACGSDYIYADTDSIKVLNPKQHEEYFNSYNNEIMKKIEQVALFRRQDPKEYSPLTLEGIEKPIGVWDFEGIYDEFKTLGAKRYMTRKGDEYTLTVAGANKRKSMKYLKETGNPFISFTNKMSIPKEYSGRLILTYIGEETSGTVEDYNGVPYEYYEKSSIHMEPSEYNLSLSSDFIRYLQGIVDISE